MGKVKVVYAEVPEELKYRLDYYAFTNKLKLREAIIKILNENLPHVPVTTEE